MAKVGNIEAICLHHLEWENDSLVVYFAQGKTEQSGENAKYPRHVYTNFTCPEICPILNRAIVLLCFSLQTDQVKLFMVRLSMSADVKMNETRKDKSVYKLGHTALKKALHYMRQAELLHRLQHLQFTFALAGRFLVFKTEMALTTISTSF